MAEEQPVMAQESMTQTEALPKSEKDIVNIGYALQALGFIVGLTFVAAIILNLVKRSDMSTEFGRKHMSYQLRTGLWSMFWVVTSLILTFALIGYVMLVVVYLWTAYRVIRGWMNATKGNTVG